METKKEEESSDENVESKQSQPRWFFVGMAMFLILLVILGFGSTYGRQLVLGLEISGHNFVETDWVIHIHAIVFIGWMLLLATQTVLIRKGQTRKHMAVGKTAGIGLAVAVLIAGSLISYEFAQAINSIGIVAWSDWPNMLLATLPNWYALLGFAIFAGLGWANRNQPAVHKRYIFLATIVLVMAATSRMGYILGPWDTYIGTGLMVAPIIVYDLYNEKSVQPVTFIGTGFIISYLIGHYVTLSVFG